MPPWAADLGGNLAATFCRPEMRWSIAREGLFHKQYLELLDQGQDPYRVPLTKPAQAVFLPHLSEQVAEPALETVRQSRLVPIS